MKFKLIRATAVAVIMAFPAVAQETGVEAEMQTISDGVKGLHERAEEGNARAAFYLASLYHNGMFVSPDRQRAMDYLKSSAEAGDPEGMYYLGLHYINGVEVDRDIDRGTELISAAADAGHTAANIAMDTYFSE